MKQTPVLGDFDADSTNQANRDHGAMLSKYQSLLVYRKDLFKKTGANLSTNILRILRAHNQDQLLAQLVWACDRPDSFMLSRIFEFRDVGTSLVWR